MAAFDVLPIAMIPASCLIILTLNNRLAGLLRVLREMKLSEIKHHPKVERFFLVRMRWIQAAILFAYSSILFFTFAAFFIILSTIGAHLLYIIVILLITGCFMISLSVLSAIVEVSYAATLFTNEEDISFKR